MKPLVAVRGSKIEGYGVFALCKIPGKKKIIEYVGRKITKAEADTVEDTRYLFELDDTWDLDGKVDWNIAGFINHSCNPNCDVDKIKGKIWVKALRQILEGEELTYNYGYDLEDYPEWPCKCKSKKCIGYMVATKHWNQVRKLEKEKQENHEKSAVRVLPHPKGGV